MSKWQIWVSVISIGSALTCPENAAWGQVQGDNTLGQESSTVTSPDHLNFHVDGGATRGSNLFHSFAQFSVPTGGSVLFNNAPTIANILSRVTGTSVSNIDGVIRANGTANLFLLNPNGIIFGPNASLQIGGSFLASTASAINFADGSQFSAIAPQSPLLTISVPLGLQFGANPGGIQVQGDGQGLRTTSDLIDTTAGLHVDSNRTLALVGGAVDLEGATLKTAGGRIELGSVAGNSVVSLTPISKGLALGYGAVPFGDIQLGQQADVDASGVSGGDVQVVGRRVTLTGGSQIEASTLGNGVGGSLVVTAQDSLQLTGTTADGQTGSGLYSEVYPGATGAGGDLTINTGMLLVQDGAEVLGAGTGGLGNGGNLTVNATREVQIIGTAPDGQYPSGLLAQTEPSASGKVGDLTINTGMLLVRDGAEVSATTFGSGDGGNLRVNAAREVQIIGTTPDGQHSSGLFAQAEPGTSGNAGDLIIHTPSLLVQNQATITVRSRGQGLAGNLLIQADYVGLDNHASLNANTTSNRSGSQANVILDAKDIVLRHGSNITTNAQGSNVIGGNITINTDNLVAVPLENSDISANSQNSFGGQVIINAQGIFGTQFTLQETPLSDITASSALGPRFNGIVQINTPGTDPSRGIAALPTNLFDPARAIANSCVARRYQPKSSFVIAGATGIPRQPDDPTVAPFPTYEMPTVASSRAVGPTEGVKQTASTRTIRVLLPTCLSQQC